MGRPAVHEAPSDAALRFTLRRVRLNAGGYDRLGTYFGAGEPLYWYASEGGEVDAMLRADSRVGAKAQIRKRYARATFTR